MYAAASVVRTSAVAENDQGEGRRDHTHMSGFKYSVVKEPGAIRLLRGIAHASQTMPCCSQRHHPEYHQNDSLARLLRLCAENKSTASVYVLVDRPRTVGRLRVCLWVIAYLPQHDPTCTQVSADRITACCRLAFRVRTILKALPTIYLYACRVIFHNDITCGRSRGSSAAPYSRHFTLISSQDLGPAIKEKNYVDHRTRQSRPCHVYHIVAKKKAARDNVQECSGKTCLANTFVLLCFLITITTIIFIIITISTTLTTVSSITSNFKSLLTPSQPPPSPTLAAPIWQLALQCGFCDHTFTECHNGLRLGRRCDLNQFREAQPLIYGQCGKTYNSSHTLVRHRPTCTGLPKQATVASLSSTMRAFNVPVMLGGMDKVVGPIPTPSPWSMGAAVGSLLLGLSTAPMPLPFVPAHDIAAEGRCPYHTLIFNVAGVANKHCFVEESTFWGVIWTYIVENTSSNTVDIFGYLEHMKAGIISQLEQKIKYRAPINFTSSWSVLMTKNVLLYNVANMEDSVMTAITKINQEEADYMGKGSCWTLTMAILACYIEGENQEHVNQHYLDLEARFDFTGLAFPTTLHQEENTIIPIQVSKEVQATYFDLFLMMMEDGNAHYHLIADFSNLVNLQVTGFNGAEILADSRRYCNDHNVVCANMPAMENGQPPDYLQPIQSCLQDPMMSHTYRYQQNMPFCYVVYIKGVAKKFMEEIVWIGTLVKGIYSLSKPMQLLMSSEWAGYNRTTTCYLCTGTFTRDNWKVHDHDHFTGAFIKAACNYCNKVRHHPKHLPNMFHNMAYDTTFIITQHIKIHVCKPCNAPPEPAVCRLSHHGGLLHQFSTVRGGDSQEVVPLCLHHIVGDTQQAIAARDWYLREQAHGTTISEEEYCYAQMAWATFGCTLLKAYPVCGWQQLLWVGDIRAPALLMLQMDQNDGDSTGHILWVDADYTAMLYEDHKELLFLPVSKLMTTLEGKLQYIHKLWVKLYIVLNTMKHQDATNTFEWDFFKLMKNAMYSKPMGNKYNYPTFMAEFDLSSYPPTHPCYSNANAKVIGKFKNECRGNDMMDFIGLRATYACRDKIVKLAKGVQKSIIHHFITIEDYRHVLLNHQHMREAVTCSGTVGAEVLLLPSHKKLPVCACGFSPAYWSFKQVCWHSPAPVQHTVAYLGSLSILVGVLASLDGMLEYINELYNVLVKHVANVCFVAVLSFSPGIPHASDLQHVLYTLWLGSGIWVHVWRVRSTLSHMMAGHTLENMQGSIKSCTVFSLYLSPLYYRVFINPTSPALSPLQHKMYNAHKLLDVDKYDSIMVGYHQVPFKLLGWQEHRLSHPVSNTIQYVACPVYYLRPNFELPCTTEALMERANHGDVCQVWLQGTISYELYQPTRLMHWIESCIGEQHTTIMRHATVTWKMQCMPLPFCVNASPKRDMKFDLQSLVAQLPGESTTTTAMDFDKHDCLQIQSEDAILFECYYVGYQQVVFKPELANKQIKVYDGQPYDQCQQQVECIPLGYCTMHHMCPDVLCPAVQMSTSTTLSAAGHRALEGQPPTEVSWPSQVIIMLDEEGAATTQEVEAAQLLLGIVFQLHQKQRSEASQMMVELSSCWIYLPVKTTSAAVTMHLVRVPRQKQQADASTTNTTARMLIDAGASTKGAVSVDAATSTHIVMRRSTATQMVARPPWQNPAATALSDVCLLAQDECKVLQWCLFETVLASIMERCWNAWAGERECPEKARREAASSSTIPTCEDPGVAPPGIELGSSWWGAGALATAPPLPRYVANSVYLKTETEEARSRKNPTSTSKQYLCVCVLFKSRIISRYMQNSRSTSLPISIGARPVIKLAASFYTKSRAYVTVLPVIDHSAVELLLLVNRNTLQTLHITLGTGRKHVSPTSAKMPYSWVQGSIHNTFGDSSVAEWLDYSHPAKSNRVRSPTELLSDFRKVGIVRRSAGLSRGSPVSPSLEFPALLHSHLISPSSALKTSVVKSRPNISQLNSILLNFEYFSAFYVLEMDEENSLSPRRRIEVSMEQCRNERAGETGDTRENPPTSVIVRDDSRMRKSGSEPAGDRTRFARFEGE
ncbi:hypothetical protein PR048_028140 [Dryococelus australis]|uniref:Uncharacterized protein n=1 Tax=Dryococelus australis TaxID=614101 RepID=A0ABQ9GIE5_9NEOP|nr:hypothetical protein PR048_028140 [Dryococelus australis]